MRKESHIARHEILERQREAARGDPVKGIPTSFVESFDTGYMTPEQEAKQNAGKWAAKRAKMAATATATATTTTKGDRPSTASTSNKTTNTDTKDAKATDIKDAKAEGDVVYNFSVESDEVQAAMSRPPYIQDPLIDEITGESGDSSGESKTFANNAIALSRILSLDKGSTAHITTHNAKRCVDTFGRHRTDAFLPPKPSAPRTLPARTGSVGAGVKDGAPEGNTNASAAAEEVLPPRAGPDTGSSEVQIAILTARIKALVRGLETHGKKDVKHKRHLRLLVHRRQKLLKYLRRRERGGPRWQYLVETLGLTEATWRGEISL